MNEVKVADRLYYESPELNFSARVADIRLVANERGKGGEGRQLWQVALDRTAFFPEGGGQPWDTGVLVATSRSGAVLEVPVERVEEDDTGEVWHYVRKPLVEGAEVEGRVDAARRMDHTQQHSGQHLVSAVFLSRMGMRTVSFHLGAESSTIDLALTSGITVLSAEEIASVEDEVNRLVYENRPLRLRWHTREEAQAMLARGDLRKLPERSGPMRVVEIEGLEFNACGGTHVASTGAIGGLMVRRTEKVKAGWRVEFVCGLRAVKVARRDFELLRDVAGLLTAGTAQIPERVRSLLESARASSKENQALTNEYAEAEASLLDGRFAVGELIEASYAKKDLPFARRLAAGLAAKGRGAVLSVVSDGEGGVLLLRPPNTLFHAGDLVRSFLMDQAFGTEARGGGSAETAQIVLKGSSANVVAGRLAIAVKELAGLRSRPG